MVIAPGYLVLPTHSKALVETCLLLSGTGNVKIQLFSETRDKIEISDNLENDDKSTFFSDFLPSKWCIFQWQNVNNCVLYILNAKKCFN